MLLVTTRERPDKIAYIYASCIPDADADTYAALYEPCSKAFMLDYYYYSQTEMKKVYEDELNKMRDFYSGKCGDDFTVKCKVEHTEFADSQSVEQFSDYYTGTYGSPPVTDAACLKVALEVKGGKGEYLTVITDFYCIKLDGQWYKSLQYPQAAAKEE